MMASTDQIDDLDPENGILDIIDDLLKNDPVVMHLENFYRQQRDDDVRFDIPSCHFYITRTDRASQSSKSATVIGGAQRNFGNKSFLAVHIVDLAPDPDERRQVIYRYKEAIIDVLSDNFQIHKKHPLQELMPPEAHLQSIRFEGAAFAPGKYKGSYLQEALLEFEIFWTKARGQPSRG
jgi:hypothetical protein